MRDMGRQRHVFLTARDDDPRIAQLHVLCAQGHRAQTRTANLVQRPGAGFFRQTGLDMRLTGGVLALTGGQHLAEDGFFNLRLVDARAGDDGVDHGSAEVMRGGGGERAVETAHGGARRRDDYDIGHGWSSLCLVPGMLKIHAALQHD